MANYSALYQNICTYNFSNPYSSRLWSRYKPDNYYETPTGGAAVAAPYTQKQLDERRKCEILKYTKNSSKMTKNEQFAAAARGTLLPKRGFAIQTDTVTNSNVAGLQQFGNRLICPTPVTRCSLTTDCNVPGRPVALCYDSAVPLYNYVRTYEYKAGEVLQSRIPTTALSAPNDLVLVGGDKQITATWSPPDKDELGTYGGAAIAGYRIAYSTDRSTWTSISGTNAALVPPRVPIAGLGKNDVYAGTTCTITGLSNNRAYYVKIDSVNALNNSSAFPALSSTTTFMVPSKPLNVTAVGDTTSNTVNNADKTSIIMSWSAPFYNGGTPITGYAVDYSSNRHTWFAKPVVLVGPDSAPQTSGLAYDAATGTYSYQFSGSLESATHILTKRTYYVRVSAINLVIAEDALPAPHSPIITVNTLTVPSAVTNIYATTGTAKGQITVLWNEPATTGGSPIQHYTVTYYEEADTNKISILGGTIIPPQTSLVVSNLSIGTRYIFSVVAHNSVYESVASTVSARTNMAPGMPIGLKTAVVNGEIILSFMIDDNGGADIAYYIVSLTTTSPDSADTVIWTQYEYAKSGAGGNASTGRVVLNLMTSSLTSGIALPSTAFSTKITYYFRVAATNTLYVAVPGVSSPASSSVFATIIVAPAPPTNVVLIFDLTGNQISWNAPVDTGGEVASKIGYIIQYSSSQGEPKVWIWYNTVNNQITTTTITIPTLRPNTNYFFKIYAVNSIGISVPTEVYNATTINAII